MTWRILVDLIKRAILSSNPSITGLWDEEVKEYARHALNDLLSITYAQEVAGLGDTAPDGCVLAVYREIPVELYQKKSRAKLPAYPVRLPRNMGVYCVAPDDDEEAQFIPVPAGQSGFIKKQGIMSKLLGGYGYEIKDGYAVFTAEVPCETVQMHLVVMDFTHYKDTDLLPIPAQMYKKVVDATVQMYASRQIIPDKTIDSNSEPTKILK